jgi:hypothetical protein
MQTLALSNYGTSELSFDEQRVTDGAWFLPALLPALLAVGAVYAVAILTDSMMNPTGCVNAIQRGFNSTQK